MVMTLALLVYSVAQRRLRAQLATHQETVPNQIKQPTPSPTLRWVFQLLEGIHRIRITVQGQAYDLIEGLHDVQVKSSGCLAMRSAVFIKFLRLRLLNVGSTGHFFQSQWPHRKQRVSCCLHATVVKQP